MKKQEISTQYISGFFDADGSITMSKSSKSKIYKTIKIDFTNTDRPVLEKIQSFLKLKKITANISTKTPTKKMHSISYTLSVNSNQMCIKLCKLLQPLLCKKKHRVNTVLKYHNLVTNRNGKYTVKEHARKLAYERLFFSSIFQ